ncbi:hypothetical protein [Pseudomonas sp. BF-R-01]|uniref:hypothetical protein n=1 Tax=Pseudomonas sp. BF-R-01 TaxID=2832365 RepID=UPI001CC104C4|nr:hypothetical protein [Pseudomonas sp. BF-R-01]
MQNPEDRVRELIRSIDGALFSDICDEECGRVAGYLLALDEFNILSDTRLDELKQEAREAEERRRKWLKKNDR